MVVGTRRTLVGNFSRGVLALEDLLRRQRRRQSDQAEDQRPEKIGNTCVVHLALAIVIESTLATWYSGTLVHGLIVVGAVARAGLHSIQIFPACLPMWARVMVRHRGVRVSPSPRWHAAVCLTPWFSPMNAGVAHRWRGMGSGRVFVESLRNYGNHSCPRLTDRRHGPVRSIPSPACPPRRRRRSATAGAAACATPARWWRPSAATAASRARAGRGRRSAASRWPSAGR